MKPFKVQDLVCYKTDAPNPTPQKFRVLELTDRYALISYFERPQNTFWTVRENLMLFEDKVEDKPKENQLGGIKHDQDKIDFALMPVIPMTEVAKVWTFGKKKYSAWNWTKGFVWSRPLAACLRHIYSWMRGEDKDPETGYSHLAHAICCLMMLIEFQETKTGEDDRYKPKT